MFTDNDENMVIRAVIGRSRVWRFDSSINISSHDFIGAGLPGGIYSVGEFYGFLQVATIIFLSQYHPLIVEKLTVCRPGE
jgi:hypothetical protein